MISLIEKESFLSFHAKKDENETTGSDVAEGTLVDLLRLLFLYTQLTANYDFLKKDENDDH